MPDPQLSLRDPAVACGYTRPRTGLPAGAAAPFRDWVPPPCFCIGGPDAAEPAPRPAPALIPFGRGTGAVLAKGLNGDIEAQRPPRPSTSRLVSARPPNAAHLVRTLLSDLARTAPGAGRSVADIAAAIGRSRAMVGIVLSQTRPPRGLEYRRLAPAVGAPYAEWRTAQDGVPWPPVGPGCRVLGAP